MTTWAPAPSAASTWPFATSGRLYSKKTSHGVRSASATERLISQSTRDSPRTCDSRFPACVRETAPTSARSGAPAMPRASSDPAQPVAPARMTRLVSIGLA